ncbi:MAG TPA: riboflavin kinase, partial [Candidatus Polarisedimenticolia bacterium]|nr:riboflavin kinase [Candidatus Polarisedimenticolia bacterium]
VVHGDARGASLGFPTANLTTASEILPAQGVYVTLALEDGRQHPSVTNIGNRPTFEGAPFAVEAHLLDAPGDLYGRDLELRFLARLRPEIRFESRQHLIRQIAADVERARRYFQRSSVEAKT